MEHPDPVVHPYVHEAGTLHFRDMCILLLRMSLQPSSSTTRQLDPRVKGKTAYLVNQPESVNRSGQESKDCETLYIS